MNSFLQQLTRAIEKASETFQTFQSRCHPDFPPSRNMSSLHGLAEALVAEKVMKELDTLCCLLKAVQVENQRDFLQKEMIERLNRFPRNRAIQITPNQKIPLLVWVKDITTAETHRQVASAIATALGSQK